MVSLSASKITSFLNCSYRAWCNYENKFPRTSTTATSIGTIVHEILELLVLEKHYTTFALILESKNIFSCRALVRLIVKKLNKENLDASYLDKISTLIYTAVKNDLRRSGCKELLIEMPFSVTGKNFNIVGFCDQVAIFEDKIVVYDFKTGVKPSGAAKDDYLNIQGLIYEWAVSKIFPGKKISVEFHYLKFKKACVVKYDTSNQELLDGLERWLEYIADYIEGMDYSKAVANMAYNTDKKFFLCGGCLGEKTKTGLDVSICEMKYPRTYFVSKKDGKIIKSSFIKSDLDKDTIIEEVTHPGCPSWSFLWKE